MKNLLPGTWKLNVAFGLLMLSTVALAARQAMLVHHGRDLAGRMALKQEKMLVPIPALPGSIFAKAASEWIPMARSSQVPSAYIDPSMVPDGEEADLAGKVSSLIDMPAGEIEKLIRDRRSSRFAWLKREINDTQAEAVKKSRISCVGLQYELRRSYPQAQRASIIVGHVRKDGQGDSGVELSQRKHLSATNGVRAMLADACRRVYGDLPSESFAPQHGGDVYLTVDTNIQRIVEEELAAAVDKHQAKWGISIIADPATGEILAMSSVYLDPRTRKPVSFDPNNFNDVPPEARTNYCLTVPYEPGSAFKPIVAAAAVDSGIINWETKVDCEAGIYFPPNGGKIGDHGSHFGHVTVWEVIAYSSNIGMAKIGLMLGNRILHKVVSEFGFGSRVNSGLPGESRGKVRPANLWDTYSTPRVPMGQEISVTGLQLVMAYCALANGGELLKPRIIAKLTDSDGKTVFESKREVIRRVIKQSTSAGILEAMRQVVENKRGTGHRTATLKNHTSFGKTGTAQVPSSPPDQPGYIPHAYTGTFIGGAPAVKPRLICLVSIHRPSKGGYYGGTVAGPAFTNIMDRTLAYLNVPADKQPETTRGRDDGPGGRD